MSGRVMSWGSCNRGYSYPGESCPGGLMSGGTNVPLTPTAPTQSHPLPCSQLLLPFLTLLLQLQLLPLLPIIAPTCFSCSDEGIGRGRKRGGKLRSKRRSRRGRGRKRRKMEEGAGGGIGERNYPSLPYCSPKGHFVIFGRMTFRKIN